MPIDKNGLIIPKEKNETSKKKTKQIIFNYIYKSISIASIIGFCLTARGLYYQKLNYGLQEKRYENEINKLQEENKSNRTQIRVSYINCYAHVLHMLINDGYHIVNNKIINWLYDKKYECISDEKIKKKLGYGKNDDLRALEITFLSLESFGTRKISNLRIKCDNILYKKDTTEYWKRFEDIDLKNKTIEFIKNKTIELGDRNAGEKLLIPLFLKYNNYTENHNDTYRKIVENEEVKKYIEGIDFYFSPDASYTFKNVYYPHQVLYYDDITDEEISVDIRDILEDGIQTTVYLEELG